ncbi:hypothetical protein DL98DRAFT_524096 [Cadophora sp. DSE1049]|nr:hypothetical protein DL98DRAFT_524096 [Cadophora sp. DSE1049]
MSRVSSNTTSPIHQPLLAGLYCRHLGDAYTDDHGNQPFSSSASRLNATNAAEYQMTNTPNDGGPPSLSLTHIDEEAFDATLSGHELNFDDHRPSTDVQYFDTTMDEHEDALDDFPWIIDESHGQFVVDYALLVEAIEALKMINFENCTPDEAILRYAHGIEAVVNRIKIPGRTPIVTVDGDGGIMVTWYHLPALDSE